MTAATPAGTADMAEVHPPRDARRERPTHLPPVDDVAAHAPYSLAGVRARRARLVPLDVPEVPHENAKGDHILNPDLAEEFLARPFKDAAVLVGIVEDAGPARAILTKRSPRLAAHAGQVAFPGGKIDPDDDSPLEAALREAEEEIGLAPSHVEPLGYGEPYLTGSGYRIFPVVALVSGMPPLRANPDEVDEVFFVPWRHLMEPVNHRRDTKEFRGVRRHFFTLPYGKRVIWGVTAGIIRTLSERLYPE